MPEFVKAADGVHIAYEIVGQGAPVVLVHGFAASRIQNWKEPGWYQTLTEAGYCVVAMDMRGHGDSDKPHDPAAYDHAIMAEDIAAVIEAAGVAPAFLMGYSMGGFISMHVLMDHPDLLQKLVIGGVGGSYLGGHSVRARRDRRCAGRGRQKQNQRSGSESFREFAEQSGKDRYGAAACMRANRRLFAASELKQSQRPVLVVCGENDALTGPPGPLADAFADGRAVVVPRRDHMTTVGDKVFKQTVLDFFQSK